MSQVYDDADLIRAFPEFDDFRPIVENEEKGAVFNVLSRRQGFRVALKVIADRGLARTKFERDFLILFNNQGDRRLVRVYDDHGYRAIATRRGHVINHFFYTMKLYDLDVEKAMLDKRLDLCSRILVALQMMDGLSFLHAKGIAHRDIKPRNLFLESLPEKERRNMAHPISTKIGDFDIAKIGRAISSAGETLNNMGTPPYMAKERWAPEPGVEMDWRPSDQYAAGITTYQILSGGHLPLTFSGVPERDYAAIHATGQRMPLVIPERVRGKTADRFPNVDKVLFRMMASEPADRFREIIFCKRELEGALASHGLWPCPHRPQEASTP